MYCTRRSSYNIEIITRMCYKGKLKSVKVLLGNKNEII